MDKNKIIAAATKHVQKGQFDKAIAEYRRILQKDPKDVRILLKIGELQQKKGENEAAATTLHDVANAYAADGFFLKAIAVFKQVLKLSPDRVSVILRLAELYQQLGLMQDAMGQLQAAAAHYEKSGAIDESADILRRMVSLEPENLASRLRLADMLAKQERTQDALAELRHAAEKLRGGSRIEDYLRVGDRIVRLDPKDQNLSRELAHAYLAKNDVRRALERLQICFQQDPKNVETLELLARAFVGVGQRAKAASVYKELARVHRERAHGADEQAAWRKVLESAPDDPEAKRALEEFASTGGRPPAPPLADEAAVPPVPPPDASRPGIPRAEPSRGVPRPEASWSTAPRGEPSRGIPRPEASWPAAPRVEPSRSMPLPEPPRAPRVEPSRSVPVAETSRPGAATPDTPTSPTQQLARLLTETDVFVKYGLADKARAHLQKIFALDPDSIAGHEKAVELLRGRDEAGLHASLVALARICAKGDVERGRPHFEELRAAAPEHPDVLALAPMYGSAVPLHDIEDDDLLLADDTGPLDVGALPGDDEPLILPVARDEEPVVLDHAELADDPEHVEPITDRAANDSFAEPAAQPQAPAFDPLNDDALFALAADTAEDDVVDEPLLGDPSGSYPLTGEADDAALELAALDALDPFAGGDDTLDLAADDEVPQDAPTRVAPAIGIDANGARTELALLPDDEVLGLTPIARHLIDETGPVDYEAVTAKQDPIDVSVQPAPRPLEPGLTPEPPMQRPAATNPWHENDAEVLAELDEAEFYMAQGMLDDAEPLFRQVLAHVPGHQQATERLGEIAALRAAVDVTPGPEAPPQGDEDLFDLGAALADELGGDAFRQNESRFQFSTLDLFGGGQQQATAETLRPEDVDTRYDLAVAYKEMGLLQDAISAFEQALAGCEGQPRAIDCLTMIGLCHGMLGEHTKAITAFRTGLVQKVLNPDVEKALHFEIALAHEAAGEIDHALEAYRNVARLDGSFRDVQAAIDRMVAAGAVARPPDPGAPHGLRGGDTL